MNRTVEERLAALEQRCEELENQTIELAGRVDRAREDLDQRIDTARGDARRRDDSLESDLDEVRRHLQALQRTVESVKRGW